MQNIPTEEEIEMMAALGVSEDKLAELRAQLQDAQYRRDAMGPQGATAGKIYVAANPLEHLAHGMNSYQGHKDAQQAQTGIAGLLDARQKGIQAAMAMHLRNSGGGMGAGMGDPNTQLLRERDWQMGQRGA